MLKSRRAVRGALFVLVAAGLLVAMLPATVSAAPSAIKIFAQMGDCGWYGDSAGNKQTIVFLWKDADGVLKSKQTLKSRANGSYDTACDYGEAIEPGDTIKATIGTKTHTLTVPTLTLEANRDSNTVSGFGPDGSTVDVSWLQVTGFYNAANSHAVTEPTDVSGAYSHDFTGDGDMKGWDRAGVRWWNAHGDSVYLDRQVPTLQVWVGRPDGASLWGNANPGTAVAVTLEDSTHVVKGSVATGADRWNHFEGDFIGYHGGRPRAIAGDYVDATAGIGSDAAWQLPSISITANVNTDKVSGICRPNDGWEVDAFSNTANRYGFDAGITTGTGAFNTDLTSQMDLRHGDKVNVYCKMPSGDVSMRHITVP
ncbi:MAG: hypothetical protein QOH61_2616 [Chloroflexota bacterium]|jgi:hypothetical protein|nr:hypothetical protein [Chloroflexota bacterium]